MDTTFSFLGLTAHAYGLCAALAAAVLLAGVKLAGKKLPCGTASLFGVLGIALGVAGARLLYCVCNIATFTETFENPWLMLRFFDGGFSWPGLAAGLMAAAAITARVMKVKTAQVLDAACLPMGLSIALMRLGEPFTDLGVGKAVPEGFATANLPWLFSQSRMGVAIEYRLNVWAYEAIIAALIFLSTLILYRRLKARDGNTALFFASLFGASQIVLESMRDDGHMLLIFLRIGQLGAALLPIVSAAILCRRVGVKERVATWAEVIVCVIGVALLEFSLDGRLTIGQPSLLRDYSIMIALSVILFARNCWLIFKTEKA